MRQNESNKGQMSLNDHNCAQMSLRFNKISTSNMTYVTNLEAALQMAKIMQKCPFSQNIAHAL